MLEDKAWRREDGLHTGWVLLEVLYVKPDKDESARRVNGVHRGGTTFVEDRLDRTPPFLSVLHIGHYASENRGCRMTRLIPAPYEQPSLWFVLALTNTSASQDKYAPRRSDKFDSILDSTVLRQSLSQLQSDVRHRHQRPSS